MFKKILFIFALLYAAASSAAVDVNKANAAELDGVKGIGPGLSSRILDERKNGNFKDWNDFIARVSGVGEKTAAKFSAEGLTVNGKKFGSAPAGKTDAKLAKAEKSDKAADKKATTAKTSGDAKTATPAAADAATKK